MSPPRRKQVPAPAKAAIPKPRNRMPAVAAVVVLAGLAAAGFWMWRGRAASRPAPLAPDPLASTSPIEAFQTGIRLASSGEAIASLPYLRRAVAGNTSLGKTHANLGAALTNAALEVHERQGRL